VSELQVLREMYGQKADGEFSILHNEVLVCDLYRPFSIVRVVKGESLRWAVHVVRTGWGGDKMHTEL
jgi:hypothetical protein